MVSYQIGRIWWAGRDWSEIGARLEPNAKDGGFVFTYITSDESLLLKTLSHIVPFMFSNSVAHDVRLNQEIKDAPVGPGGKPPELGTWYNILTIPGYFAVNMVNSVGVLLDVKNWGSNYGMIVENDFKRNDNKPSE